ncbi:hypothetical protein GH714_021575 [Hevea brasiliensis]|uniref:YTH domain-containing family protein n=1 Tax=Hevea brasiliensis TaxID=3981 RepID=A0A6A6N2T6_HEVBR|nr:hypothetical protein GH714_021575 [Hevea brasiliensis]
MADEVEAGHEKMSGRHFVGAPATFLILVGNAYDFVNAAEPVPTGLKSESIRKLAGRDVASGKDGLPSGSTSSSCSSRDATSNTKVKEMHVSDVSNGNTGSQMENMDQVLLLLSPLVLTLSLMAILVASTLNGNKKLDAAFREAEQRSGGTGTKCPIFLFFSVNGSGQFVGIAEMVGQVDFDKDMDFWQLDKWNGFFPVRWHVIKDITNSHLRHIILENNDGQPVTYSRGSQEIGVLDLSKVWKC